VNYQDPQNAGVSCPNQVTDSTNLRSTVKLLDRLRGNSIGRLLPLICLLIARTKKHSIIRIPEQCCLLQSRIVTVIVTEPFWSSRGIWVDIGIPGIGVPLLVVQLGFPELKCGWLVITTEPKSARGAQVGKAVARRS